MNRVRGETPFDCGGKKKSQPSKREWESMKNLGFVSVSSLSLLPSLPPQLFICLKNLYGMCELYK